MPPFLNSPLWQRREDNTYTVILYGGGLLVSLYFTYLAWAKPDEYLDITELGLIQIPFPENVRMFIGRYVFPFSVFLWIALLYLAFSS